METIIKVGRLIDGTGAEPLTDVQIRVSDGRVTAVEPQTGEARPGERVLDYSALTALPGFIDLHTHFCYPLEAEFQKSEQRPNRVSMVVQGFASARDWLTQGVTTARVVGTHFDLDLGLRDLIEEQPALGPRLAAAGRMMTMVGGKRTPWDRMKDEVNGAEEARRWTRAHLAEGADLIKLYCTTLLEENVADYLQRKMALPDDAPDPGRWGALNVDEIRATVDEAHKLGRTVAAHTSPSFGIKLALRGGVDTVDHGSDLDDECIELFLETGATLVPTLLVTYHQIANSEESGAPEVFTEFSRRRWPSIQDGVRRAFEAGVPIGTGTDNVMAGMDYRKEIELLTEVGLPPMEAIRCATQRAAACMGEAGEDVGTLEPGKWADVVLVDGDPLQEIAAIYDVAAVVKAGEIVASAEAEEVRHG